jgi:YegS C-terminal NAD kinase beta sandwich-like domain
MIDKGEPWGRPVAGPPDLEVHGDDVALAVAVRTSPGARVRFVAAPASDLARAVGLADVPAGQTELPVDALVIDVAPDDSSSLAVNMVVLGIPPDRLRAWHRRRRCTVAVDERTVFEGHATTVVVANGQFLRGLDVVPRGHPGDGRGEVQVYALGAMTRRAMRRRLPTGDHVPHPQILQRSGRTLTARFERPQPFEVDGRTLPARSAITVDVAPEALVLLV